jgi:hypothetical protein
VNVNESGKFVDIPDRDSIPGPYDRNWEQSVLVAADHRDSFWSTLGRCLRLWGCIGSRIHFRFHEAGLEERKSLKEVIKLYEIQEIASDRHCDFSTVVHVMLETNSQHCFNCSAWISLRREPTSGYRCGWDEETMLPEPTGGHDS